RRALELRRLAICVSMATRVEVWKSARPPSAQVSARRTLRSGVVSMASVQVRYIVTDIDAAIAFYTTQLGFRLEMHPAPPFAMLSRGDLRLVLSVPNASGGGGQAMPDGTVPQPGGWNRFAIQVNDLAELVGRLRAAGVRFRNEIVTGVGGKQILVEDPSGNPVQP